MSQVYNIYCDESCHLENDGHPYMILGAVWCPLEKAREVSIRVREIKEKHGLGCGFESKWTKVSEGKADFYQALLDYFFDDDDLHFRALIAPKADLRHEEFQQTHDEWYYKMYFDMLKILLSPEAVYRIYLDIKDTRGSSKIKKLHEVLSNNAYDFSRKIIEHVQLVRSHESEMIQLADLLTGIISYANRDLSGNAGKSQLVERMRKRSGYNLTQTTLLQERKVNLFRWTPTE